jgi:hypothetical protein
MPQLSFNTQIDVIMVAFVLHNYIRINSQDDAMFTVFEQHPNYIPHDELPDTVNSYQGSERPEGRSTKTKKMCNNIVALL